MTDVPEEKQGVVVALSLPENEADGVRERVFDEMSLTDLKKKDGLALLMNYLDKQLGKDDLTDSLEKFENFEEYVREPGQSILEYISKFDQKYNKIMKLKMIPMIRNDSNDQIAIESKA